MAIDILAIGSRGDVQPYIALGLGLRAAGYRVRIVTLGGFEGLIAGYGLDHLVVARSPGEIGQSAEGQDWIQQRAGTRGFMRGLLRLANSLVEEGMANYWRARRDVKALIVSPMALLLGGHLAERLQAQLIQAQLVPPVVASRYRWDGEASLRSRMHNRIAVCIDTAFKLFSWSQLRQSTNAARQSVLALPPLPLGEPLYATFRERTPLLGGYSQAVAPRLPDWSEAIHVTGYWFLDDLPGWAPSAELVEFLRSGPAPLFIGFGSTPFPQPEATTQLVVRAVARAGQRAILVTGGSGLGKGRLNDEVLGIDSVPHSWLFSRVCAAVHHGGAGVTGAALRAGLPSVVVPIFADQPFWAGRLFELGAAATPIPAQRLNEDDLTQAILAATGSGMRQRAAELGERIRAEDGVTRAVEVIDGYVRAGVVPAGHQHAH